MNRDASPRPGSVALGVEPASGAEPLQISRFIRETLEAYASESVADEVLRTALALGRLGALPTTHAALRELVDVHLVQSTTAVMGEELAEAVRQRLLPLLALVGQMEAVQPRAERITLVDGPSPAVVVSAPARSATTTRPPPELFDDRTPTVEIEAKPFSVVLFVGREPDVATQLKSKLDARTAVIPVEEPMRLIRDLRVLRTQPRMLVIDLRRPHGLLDALRGEPTLLDGAIVLLWGATREVDADVKRAFPGARVVRCAPDATLLDLAAVVRLGPGK